MKVLLGILLFISALGPLEVNAKGGPFFSSFERTLLHSIASREYCFCKYDKFSANNLSLRITDEYRECKALFFATMESTKNKKVANAKIANIIRGNDSKKTGVICSKAEIKDKLQEYSDAQEDTITSLKLKVETILCEGDGELKNQKGVVKKCRKKLKDLVSEHEEEVFKGCKEEFVNAGRRRRVNDCVERNVYEYLWKNHSNNYFVDYCPVGSKERETCVASLREKLKQAYFKEEVKYCHNPENFHEKQEKAILVCEDLLLSKVLSLALDEEMEALVRCLNPLGANDTEGIKKCVATFRNKGDPAEQDLLKQIRDKYCSAEIYALKQDQDNCLSDFLNANMVDLNVSEKCKTQSSFAAEADRDVAFTRCQRMESYKKLLDTKQLEVSDCWNKQKYTDMASRRDCRDEAVVVNKKIRKCEKLQDPEQISACLSKIENKDFLKQYLLTKAYKLGIDVSSCSSSSPTYTDCLMKLLHDQAGNFAGTDKNSCFRDKASSDCVSNSVVNEAPILSGTDTGMTGEKSNSTGGNTSQVLDSLVAKKEDTGSSGGDVLKSNAGKDITSNGDEIGSFTGPDGNIESNLESFVQDVNNLGTKGDEDACSSIRTASIYGVGGVIASQGVIISAGNKAKSDLENSDDVQQASIDGMGSVYQAGMLGSQILQISAIAKEREAEVGMTGELQKVSSGAPPTVCKKDKTASMQLPPLDYKLYTNYIKSLKFNIAKASSQDEIDQLLKEFDDLSFGSQLYSTTSNPSEDWYYDESDVLPAIKQILFSAIGFMGDSYISNAYADDAASIALKDVSEGTIKENLSQSGLDANDSFQNMNKKLAVQDNADALSRLGLISDTAREDTSNYTNMVNKSTKNAGAFESYKKKVKDAQ